MRKKTLKEKKGRFVRNIETPLAIGTFLILVMLVIHAYLQKRVESGVAARDKGAFPPIEELNRVLIETLNAHGASYTVRTEKALDFWRIEVPPDLSIPSLHLAIQEGIRKVDARILFAESEPLSGRVSLKIGWQDSCFIRASLLRSKSIPQEQGRIAIIVDDFGDRWNSLVKSFLDLKTSVTYSVIPGMEMSSRVAREMIQNGCEVILHMPMEPISASFGNNKYMIRSDMSREKIGEIIQKALDEVPGAVGMNNHMGSKVTSDRRAITCVLEELKSRGLYFVDSRTTTSTIAYDIAKSLNLACGKRDVFLDVEQDRETIRKGVWELAQKAKTKGFSIGIGHCYPMTLEILREEMPKIKAKGFRFVHISEVVR